MKSIYSPAIDLRAPVSREFHISRECRDLIGCDRTLFASTGNVVFADFQAVRDFTHCLHQSQLGTGIPEEFLKAGQINAMGLIDEILHQVIRLYEQEVDAQAMTEVLFWLRRHWSGDRLEKSLDVFSNHFPPGDLYRGEIPAAVHFERLRTDPKVRSATIEELLMLRLANENRAFSPYRLLFDDRHLHDLPLYSSLLASLYEFFETRPHFGPENQNLIDLLLAPSREAGHSLTAQLEFIRTRWGLMLKRIGPRILLSMDMIREDSREVAPGPPPPPLVFDPCLESGEERFTTDTDWMPHVVMIAKSVHVWLEQLSRTYGRSCRTLADIPDEELSKLAGWGFNALWLIGIWKRSEASRTIKRSCGNPEALASAYSLFAYEIAGDLGGEESFRSLRERALRQGIRLAADMVPNHMGIDSHWVHNHAEWFVQLDHPPFPAYRFSGPDLSSHPDIGIFLEDHYYTRQDAAVVFKWVDRRSGQTRYIYHGNDGTRMPWNDTAQLNYLLPAVREAVMRTVIDVSKRFPIIRFDAAMTLAKKHYQRLWFPTPGSGGDIPSRSGHGLTKAQYDRLMPVEFWRELVDRMAAESPDTLLLAEAFWLMEGYFVRTLGMHRVYNSAFMNFLKMEDNASFRKSLKEVIGFNREILRRYVNFLNNPDEETAITQFGKGDKYFGVCTLLATMPGLPMFGHGQIEGFQEKYGMEYGRSYWSERPDVDLIRRHEERIFPLLRKRHLFSGVERFRLYDFIAENGSVNENVIAFSNACGQDRALVLVNNAYERTNGSILFSSDGGGTVFEHLGVRSGDLDFLYIIDLFFHEEYLFNSRCVQDRGLSFSLEGYQSLVFLEFTPLADGERAFLRRLVDRFPHGAIHRLKNRFDELIRDDFQDLLGDLVKRDRLQAFADWVLKGETGDKTVGSDWMHLPLSGLFSLAPFHPATMADRLREVATWVIESVHEQRMEVGGKSIGEDLQSCFHEDPEWIASLFTTILLAAVPPDALPEVEAQTLIATVLQRELPVSAAMHLELVKTIIHSRNAVIDWLNRTTSAELFFSRVLTGVMKPYLIVQSGESQPMLIQPRPWRSLVISICLGTLIGASEQDRERWLPRFAEVLQLAEAADFSVDGFLTALKNRDG